MFRFATVFALTACVAVGVGVVPAANAAERDRGLDGNFWVTNNSDKTVTVYVNDRVVMNNVLPHTSPGVRVWGDDHHPTSLHAVATDGTREWRQVVDSSDYPVSSYNWTLDP